MEESSVVIGLTFEQKIDGKHCRTEDRGGR